MTLFSWIDFFVMRDVIEICLFPAATSVCDAER